ncbi:hypothetical protein E2C01_015533 [Portunus trituberculatus]|uniref:Uncharacterized protein n=1 Tax=Portunus trituberculatus TaxID=210409 RepID=A0A5B7DNH2_PORTR|nr:hypothetical protein [Portunus trituberculatus]
MVSKVVVPGDVLQGDGAWQLDGTTQVDTLPPCHYHLLLGNASITKAWCGASHILQQPEKNLKK